MSGPGPVEQGLETPGRRGHPLFPLLRFAPRAPAGLQESPLLIENSDAHDLRVSEYRTDGGPDLEGVLCEDSQAKAFREEGRDRVPGLHDVSTEHLLLKVNQRPAQQHRGEDHAGCEVEIGLEAEAPGHPGAWSQPSHPAGALAPNHRSPGRPNRR